MRVWYPKTHLHSMCRNFILKYPFAKGDRSWLCKYIHGGVLCVHNELFL